MTITMYRGQGKWAADALKSKNQTIIKEKSLMLFLARQDQKGSWSL
jgi:hypothetical protein